MYTEDDLSAAVDAGILERADAQAFRDFIAQRVRPGGEADDEFLRLVGGFSDIFVLLACLLVLGGIAWNAWSAVRWHAALGMALTAWGLAEVFVRRQRMALSAIALAVTFAGGAGVAAYDVAGRGEAGLSFAVVTAMLACAVHWRRFHVPITLALGLGSTILLTLLLILQQFPAFSSWLPFALGLAGLLNFVLAMRWDMSDPARRSWRTDVAFWLHILAAGLISHAVFGTLNLSAPAGGTILAGKVLILYAVLTLVSLAIDRRALMVSALAYAFYAFSTLLQAHDVVSGNYPITALVIGLAWLGLAAGWHTLRRRWVRCLPVGLRRCLPPVDPYRA